MARIRPVEAHRAMRALMENPDDTAQAFRVIAALSGSSGKRIFRRFRQSPTGSRILAERRSLFDALKDTEQLRRMPPGSLGAGIAEYFTSEELSAQGLADASQAAFSEGGPHRDTADEEIFGARLRDMHDIFHVLTGYGRDLRGEAAVLAFTVPQTRNPGVAYLVGRVLLRAGWGSELGQLVRRAFRRGARARWLLDQDWEANLERPLDELRHQLGVGEPPVYEPVRSAGAPAV